MPVAKGADVVGSHQMVVCTCSSSSNCRSISCRASAGKEILPPCRQPRVSLNIRDLVYVVLR